MNIIGEIFKNRKVNLSKLACYGFTEEASCFVYERRLAEQDFIMIVTITTVGDVTAEIIDTSLDEPYTLHLVEGATGAFVGGIKIQYEEILTDIAKHCFDCDVFKYSQAKEVIEYVKCTYGDELEFLWKKSPQNAIWRRKDTDKWYGALLTVSKKKLGLESDEIAEIIDLRIPPDELEKIIDNKIYFAGYHMNKKHWLTIVLDNSVSSEEIYSRIDKSYLLATK